MRNYLHIHIFLILVFFFLSIKTHASHIGGGEINYTCTSTPGIWLITTRFYEDCNAPMICNGLCGTCSFGLQITGADPLCNGTSYGSVTLSLVSVKDMGGLNVKSICTNNGCSTAGTFSPGYEIFTFQGMVNLGPSSGIPTTCCNVRLSFTQCCSPITSNTGSISGSNNFYCDAVINRCASPCDNSPKFTNFENCMYNGKVYQSFGATDIDGDSLSYSFTPWLQNLGTSAIYTTPYTSYPYLAYAGNITDAAPNGFHFDTQTGFMQFTPNIASTFEGSMGITVKEWRTIGGIPVNIGTVNRYFIVYMTSTPNNSMHIATNPLSPANEPATDYYVCAGSSLCFDVIAKDTNYTVPALSDTSFVLFDTAMFVPGMTVTNNYSSVRPREDSKHFCWTPDTGYVRSQPYTFTVYIKNAHTPVPAWESRPFRIFVVTPPGGSIVKTVDICKKWQLTFSQPSTVSGSMWKICKTTNSFSTSAIDSFINIISTPMLGFSGAGKFPVTALAANQGCFVNFVDTITNDTPINISVRDTSFCKGGTATFTYAAHNGTPRSSPNYTYRWYTYPDTFFTVLNDPFLTLNSFSISPQSTKRLILEVRDWNGCRAFDSSVWINVGNPVFSLPDSMRICSGTSYIIDRGNNNGNVRNYSWSSGEVSRTITRNATTVAALTITDTIGCSNTDTFRLFVNLPVNVFAGNDTNVCYGSPLKYKANIISGKPPFQYLWKNSSNAVLSSSDSLQISSLLDNQKYYLSVTDSTGCSQTDSIQVTVNPLPALIIHQTPIQACKSTHFLNLPSFSGNITSNSQNGGTGVWMYPYSPGAIINGTPIQLVTDSLKNLPSDTINYSAANDQFQNYIACKYTSPSNKGGCSNYDSVPVTMYGVPYVIAGFDVRWCKNSGIFRLKSDLTRQSPYSLWIPTPYDATGQFGVWTGNGVNAIANGSITNFEFDPAKSGVLQSPSKNILTYTYTKQYSYVGSPTCVNQDTVAFEVIPTPIVYAGALANVMSTDPVFNINFKSGSSTTGSGGFWTYAPVIPLYGIDIALPDSQNLDPSKVTIPTPQTQWNWKLFFNDISTGCPAKDSLYLTVVKSSTGVNNQNAFDHFKLYPNPTNGFLNITFTTDEKLINIEVVDILGKVSRSFLSDHSAGLFQTEIDLSELPKGIYFVKIKAGTKTVVNKITLE